MELKRFAKRALHVGLGCTKIVFDKAKEYAEHAEKVGSDMAKAGKAAWDETNKKE